MRISDWSSDVCSSDLLLYSSVEPGKCRSDLLQVRDAFLCGRYDDLRSAFNAQLWSALEQVALTSIAWCVVARWRWRAWLVGPLVFATALLVLMLPMAFGARLRSTRYPVVSVPPADRLPAPPTPAPLRRVGKHR